MLSRVSVVDVVGGKLGLVLRLSTGCQERRIPNQAGVISANYLPLFC